MPEPQPQPKAADVKLRNEFASIALREIVRYQLANNKFGEQSLAATLAFKYADNMVAQSQQPPARQTFMVKGAPVVYEPASLGAPLPEPVAPELPGAAIPTT